MPTVSLTLTPHGHLTIVAIPDAPPLDPDLARRLQHAFDRGSGHGLLQLGADDRNPASSVLSYWREFGASYVTALCTHSDTEPLQQPHVPTPTNEELNRLVLAAPLMTGAEYLTADSLRALWQALDTAFKQELAESKRPIQEFLKRRNPAWNLVGRVHFNLAENRKDQQAPFAFLATYTTRLSSQAKASISARKALGEYAARLTRIAYCLFFPVQRASETCPWLKAIVDKGEIFHPLRWTPGEAMQFTDVPQLEAAGVVVRMPATWRATVRPRPRVTAHIGGKAPSGLGQNALLDFQMEVTRWRRIANRRRDQRAVSQIRRPGAGTRPLGRGRSGAADRVMDHFRQVERTAAADSASETPCDC